MGGGITFQLGKNTIVLIVFVLFCLKSFYHIKPMPPPTNPSISAKRRAAGDFVEISHDRLVTHMTSSSFGSATAPSQYLEEALADCVEHRLNDPIHFLFHHLRHLKIMLTSETSSSAAALFCGPSAGAPSSTSSNMKAPQIQAQTVQLSLQGNTRYFDRLHRYVFQHEGGRAIRSCFFIFQHSENIGTMNDSTNHLAMRSALFACFADLFFVSQRLDQASSPAVIGSSATLPANEFSRVPYKLVLAFACAVLEEHFLCVASPQTLLHGIISFVQWSCIIFKDTLSVSLQEHLRSTSLWVETASAESASFVLKAIVKLLEDLLRCGPTTIVTATTRKKRDSATVLPAAVLAFSNAQTQGDGVVLSSALAREDENTKDLLVRTLEVLCGSPVASGARHSKPVVVPVRIQADLNTFGSLLEHLRVTVHLFSKISAPLYSLLEARCSFTGVGTIPCEQVLSCLADLKTSPSYLGLLSRFGDSMKALQRRVGGNEAHSVGETVEALHRAITLRGNSSLSLVSCGIVFQSLVIGCVA